MSRGVAVPDGQLVGAWGGFAVVLVRKGCRYGVDNGLVHDRHDPLVEFYDLRYAGRPGFTVFGQFVARYYLSTLVEGEPARGLCMDMGIPHASINGRDLAHVLDAVDRALGDR